MTTFNDLPESMAEGAIADIYAEIRYFGGVPYVSSLQRQLATIPGCLEWLWPAIRPRFANGQLPETAWRAVAGLALPSLPAIPAPALRSMGVDAPGEAPLHAIYETFLRASPVNMATASLLGYLLAEPGSAPIQAPDANWNPPDAPAALPDILKESALSPETAALLDLFEVDMDGAAFVPGLYRLLAHWPGYLAHVATEILPLFAHDDVLSVCTEIVTRIDGIVPPLCEGLAAGPPPFDQETAQALKGSLAVYRGTTSPQMIVFSTILKRALPSG